MAQPFALSGTPEEIEARLGALNEQAQRRLREATEARKAMEQMSASAESDGGAVRVTVSSTGALTALDLSKAVSDWSPSTIATKILACVQRAQAGLADRAQEVMAETMSEGSGGIGSVVVGQLRRSFPTPQSGPMPAASTAGAQPTEMAFGPEEDYDAFQERR